LELVQILEASSESLKRGGGPVDLSFRPNSSVRQNAGARPVHQARDLSVKVIVEAVPNAAARALPKKDELSRQPGQPVTVAAA
jgi:hypothetical protein